MIKIRPDYKSKTFIKQVSIIAIPLIISSIIASLIRISDNTMVGIFQDPNSGELASTSLVGKYFSIASVVITAYLATTTFLINQYIGKKDTKKVSETLKIQIIGGFVLAIILIMIAYFFNEQIMEFFQGDNFTGKGSHSASTANGVAQEYLKQRIWMLIPWFLLSIGYLLLVSFGRQKIVIPLSIFELSLNIFLNWLFYSQLKMGLDGIAYSTIFCNVITLGVVFYVLYANKEARSYIFNSWKRFWVIDWHIIKIGLKKWAMALQILGFRLVLIGSSIIYSRWYGDEASDALAIVLPVATMFYSALEGIAKSKGILVGKQIGKGDKEGALANDKRINLYTFITATIEGGALMLVGLLIPFIWSTTSSDVHLNAQICMIAIGVTYPCAALTNALTGSFKVAGKGKTIILSNTSIAVALEFGIPFILFMIYSFTSYLGDFPFWGLYLIARSVKLFKFPLTYRYWKKQEWLEKII